MRNILIPQFLNEGAKLALQHIASKIAGNGHSFTIHDFGSKTGLINRLEQCLRVYSKMMSDRYWYRITSQKRDNIVDLMSALEASLKKNALPVKEQTRKKRSKSS